MKLKGDEAGPLKDPPVRSLSASPAMSSSNFYAEIQNMAPYNEILKPHEIVSINPSPSTESVDIVQLAPLTAKEQIEAREKALKDRALQRLERRERNHQLADEACQVGDALFDQKDYVGASTCYFDATNLWPSSPESYVKLARTYIQRGLYVDATHAATRALSFDPKSLEARYYRGVARLEQGLLPAAKIGADLFRLCFLALIELRFMSDFEIVIAHDPVHVLAHSSLGRTLSLLQATKIGSHVLYPPSSDVTPDGEPVDFAFPRYDDDKLEIAEPSDSSDCNHVGNGVPCRFYNHDGCARGIECDFSHAPDEKSVRDDLGKNVCLYYLLSSCKFGDLKCIYSHSKDALPSTHGWWNDPKQVKRVKEVLELAEQKAKEKRVKGVRAQRTDAKKARVKGQGRGKRDISNSKPKERRGKTQDGKSAVEDVETPAIVEHDAKKENGEADAAKGVVGEPKIALTDDSNDRNGPQTEEDREPKKQDEKGADTVNETVKTSAEPSTSSHSTSKSGLETTEERQVLNREATDPQ
ncbi:hypothetical protein C0989_000905 [Termitomyces sp. Mn162]|nr:hypothetical protein C0989_000905 [Termitomyces sp. Mn162]